MKLPSLQYISEIYSCYWHCCQYWEKEKAYVYWESDDGCGNLQELDIQEKPFPGDIIVWHDDIDCGLWLG